MSRDIKYIGMDVHTEAIVIAMRDGSGKLVMEAIVEIKASSLLQFLHGLRGELHVTWEEGTWAAWLYDLLKPQVHEVLVCNPRRNALLKEGSKNDKVDAGKLSEQIAHIPPCCRTLRFISFRISAGDLSSRYPREWWGSSTRWDSESHESWLGNEIPATAGE